MLARVSASELTEWAAYFNLAEKDREAEERKGAVT